VLLGLPDEATRSNRYELAVPGLASLYLGHSWDAEVRGLNDFVGEHPPVMPVFVAFRVMVGIGVLMLVVSWSTLWQLRRGGEPGRLMSAALVAMTFAGWVALVAGWYVTEIGRQPWLVQGVLTTAEAVADHSAGRVGLTLAMYLVLYAGLLVAFVSVLFHLARKAGHDDRARDLNPAADSLAQSGVRDA